MVCDLAGSGRHHLFMMSSQIPGSRALEKTPTSAQMRGSSPTASSRVGRLSTNRVRPTQCVPRNATVLW